MSRTFRTNKFGRIKTDKYEKNFNRCTCASCEFSILDIRNIHRENFADKEIEYNIFFKDYD